MRAGAFVLLVAVLVLPRLVDADTTFVTAHNPFYGETTKVQVARGSIATFRVSGMVADVVSQNTIQYYQTLKNDKQKELARAADAEIRVLNSTGGYGSASVIAGMINAVRQKYDRLWTQASATFDREKEAALRKYTNWYVNGVFQETDASNGSNGYADPALTKTISTASVVRADVLDGNFSLIRSQVWEVSVTQPVGVSQREQPARFSMSQNAPNPFNSNTTVRFLLPEAGQVRLAVYDLTGDVVRTLIDGHVAAGFHQVAWDGTDAVGRKVASGVYFCRLTGSKGVVTRRVVVAR